MDAESIAGILDGRKTRTSRVIVPQPSPRPAGAWWWDDGYYDSDDLLKQAMLLRCPYSVGETVAITERALYWSGGEGGTSDPVYADDPEVPLLLADNDRLKGVREANRGIVGKWNWRPPFLMRADQARFHARITSREAGRIQSMTQEQIAAEGWDVRKENPYAGGTATEDAHRWWRARWDGINAKRGYPYSMNPWAYGYGFEVVQAPGADVEVKHE